MTLVADPDGEVTAPEEPDEPSPKRRRLPALPKLAVSRARIRRIATIAVGSVVGLLLVWLICADPIAHVWYQTRQRSLTGQTVAGGSELGSQIVHEGGSVGVIQSADLHLNLIVAQGDSPQVLRGGPGHRPGTPLPGARGNSVIVGHSSDWGAPFKSLDKLTPGSTLYVQSHVGVAKAPQTGYFIYTVTSVKRVSDDDVALMAPSNDHRLTLVTGAGSRLSGDRVLVVTAVSGKEGRITGRATGSSLEPSRGSFFSSTLLRFLVTAAVAAAVIVLLRRRHRPVTAFVVATPLVLLATWTLFLEFDMVAFRPLA